MDAANSTNKTPNRNRLSLILKLSDENVPASTEITTPPQASASSTSNASPISAAASPSPKTRSRRSSFLFSSSPLSSILRSPMAASRSPPSSPGPEQGSLARKARGLSEAFLKQLASPEVTALGEGSSAQEPTNAELGLALPGTPSQSSQSLSLPTRRLRRSASASSTHTIQRVKSFIMPHPSIPEMRARKVRVPRHEGASSSSLAVASPSATPSIAEDIDAEQAEPSAGAGATYLAPPPTVSALSLQPPQSAPPFLPQPQPQSPITLDSPADSIEEYPVFQDAARTSPMQENVKRKRRMSFDFASLRSQPLFVPASLPSSPAPSGKSGLGRSKTVLGPRERQKSEEVVDETEKAMNVRRAHKMLTLFGSEPPFALYQVNSNTSDHNKTDGDTLMIPPVSTARQRDSLTTIVSLASLRSAHRRSSSASTTLGTPSKKPRTPSPAPFDFTTRMVSEPLPTLTPPVTPITPTPTITTTRRRRAAKLARFFGVGYRDVSDATPSPAPKMSSASLESTSRTPPTSPAVNVQVTSPAWFWGRRNTSRDVDMDDVIGRLRTMKAAR